MLTIWGRANSANVKKVLWIAEELDLAYRRIDAGGAFGGLETAEYRAMNPMGLVPVLQDGDLTLFESNVIVRYLAARYGVGSLWIDDPATRATAEMWMDWNHTLGFVLRDAIFGLLRTPPEKRDHAAIERSVAEGARLVAIAAAALDRSPWLSGADFGIGDIPFGSYFHTWKALPIAHADHPALDDWYARLLRRPGYAKVVAIPVT